MECGCAENRARTALQSVLTQSVQAVLEQVEAKVIATQFDALELLDRDADTETLHETSFAPHYGGA